MEILISIIVPVFNTHEMLKKCIESIKRNKFQNYEIIIVDDGSDADTANVCDFFARKYSNIDVYHIDNHGVSYARNYGIRHSSGEYIMFIDSDDLLEQNALEILYSVCTNNKADLVVANYYSISDKGRRTILPNNNKNLLVLHDSGIMTTFLKTDCIRWTVWGKIFKRSAIQGCFFPVEMKTAEDMYFMYQVCKKVKKVMCIPDYLYEYRDYKDSTMNSSGYVKFFDTYLLIDKVYSEEKENFTDEASHFFIERTFWLLKFLINKNRSFILTKDFRRMAESVIEKKNQNRERKFSKVKIEVFVLEILLMIIPRR